MEMSIETEVREFIDQIEIKFDKLWETLKFFKGERSEQVKKQLVDYQINLADCQDAIDKKFREVRTKQKDLRKTKNQFDKVSFSNLDKEFSKCEQALTGLIYLGKSLGDAFVWFFLQNDREILDEHLKHQDEFLMPSGTLGRKGEIEFLRKYKMLNNKFIIYHGITSILRVGDFSIVDLKTHRLTGISELKTDSIHENELTTRLITFGKKDRMREFMPISKSPGQNENKDSEKCEKDERDKRLDKQIDTMLSVLKGYEKTGESHEFFQHKSYLEFLEEAMNKSHENYITFLKAREGMLFVVIRPNQVKLSERLFDFDHLKDLDQYVLHS